MKRLVGYFLQGFVYIAPLGVTMFVVYKVFTFVEAPVKRIEEMFFGKHIPGTGLVTVVVLLTFLGWLGSTIIARPFKMFTRKLLDRAPLLGSIEGGVRDLLAAFFAKDRRFTQPVLVRVNTVSDLEKLGFITQGDLHELGLQEKVAVYFPHSYNFSGELFIVPREHVRPVDLTAQEAMKFIVTGGLIRFSDHREGNHGRPAAGS